MRLKSMTIGMGVIAVTLAASSAMAGPDDAKVKKEIMAGFYKSVKQFKAKDLKGFMTMFADDYSGVSMDGRPQTKKSVEADFKTNMANTKSLDVAELKIDKLTTKGNTADLESTLHLEMRAVDSKGEMGPKGKEHKMSIWERSKETWAKGKSGWQAKTGAPLPGGKMLLDGKPMQAPPKPMKPSTKAKAKS